MNLVTKLLEDDGPKNTRELNAYFKKNGLTVQAWRDPHGYFYWLKDGHSVLGAESIYVYRASHMTFDQWLEVGKEAEQAAKDET